jgi:hypothetical protein
MSDFERGNVECEFAQLYSSDKTATDGSYTITPDHGDGLAPSKAERTETSKSTRPERSDARRRAELGYDDIFKELSKLHHHRRTDTSSETEIVDTMHLRNLWHLRSKISKHILISSAAQEGLCDGKFEQGEETNHASKDSIADNETQ